jgi:hypothetical protein
VSFGFSSLGAAYLGMLFIPNLLWARLRGRQAAPVSPKESPSLLVLERFGQVATTIAVLFAPVRESPRNLRLACLGASLLTMVFYEFSWLRYFRSERTDARLYRSLGPVPLPLAILPVMGFLLLAIYEVHAVLVAAVIVLGVGHVGIHRQHARRLR